MAFKSNKALVNRNTTQVSHAYKFIYLHIATTVISTTISYFYWPYRWTLTKALLEGSLPLYETATLTSQSWIRSAGHVF